MKENQNERRFKREKIEEKHFYCKYWSKLKLKLQCFCVLEYKTEILIEKKIKFPLKSKKEREERERKTMCLKGQIPKVLNHKYERQVYRERVSNNFTWLGHVYLGFTLTAIA